MKSKAAKLEEHINFVNTNKAKLREGIEKGYDLKALCRLLRKSRIPVEWAYFSQAAKETLL